MKKFSPAKSRKKPARPSSKVPRKKDEARELARVICSAALEIKAEELKILDVRILSGFTDYLVIASGMSGRQVKAISDHLQGVVHKKYGRNPLGVEGEEQATWILIDYGDVVVHLFQTETRAFYRLEELWHDAKRIKFKL